MVSMDLLPEVGASRGACKGSRRAPGLSPRGRYRLRLSTAACLDTDILLNRQLLVLLYYAAEEVAPNLERLYQRFSNSLGKHYRLLVIIINIAKKHTGSVDLKLFI